MKLKFYCYFVHIVIHTFGSWCFKNMFRGEVYKKVKFRLILNYVLEYKLTPALAKIMQISNLYYLIKLNGKRIMIPIIEYKGNQSNILIENIKIKIIGLE